MGHEQSTVRRIMKRNPKKPQVPKYPPDQKMTHSMYKNYRWNPTEVAEMIENDFISPMFPPDENASAGKVFCSICYCYFPMVNRTGCCNHQICSECLSAIVDAPPLPRKCPFCKKEGFEIICHISTMNGGTVDDGDDIEFVRFDERRKQGLEDKSIQPSQGRPPNTQFSPEAVEIANQYGTSIEVIEEMLQAGIPQEEIVLQLSLK